MAEPMPHRRREEIRGALESLPAYPWQWHGPRTLTTTGTDPANVLSAHFPSGGILFNAWDPEIGAPCGFTAGELAERGLPNPVGHWIENGAQYAAELLADNDRLGRELAQAGPARTGGFPAVTICGSMRFYPRMLEVAAKLTTSGQIVLMPHDATLTGIPDKTAIEHGAMLDAMHRAKIRMSGLVHIVNTGGYIGESTRGEIAYATELGIPIDYDERA